MDLKKQIKNTTIYVILGSIAIPTALTVWFVSEQIRVKPLERQIVEYGKTIKTLNDTVKELRNDPGKKKVEELASELGVTKSSLKQWQDVLPLWQKANSELKQKLDTYESNCNIFSEIHSLDSRKTELEKNINTYTHAGHSNDDEVIEWRRQTDHYQIRILDLQKRLLCQQP